MQGKNIEEIARERHLVASTIASHLGHYIQTGELDINLLVDMRKQREVAACAAKFDGTGSMWNFIKANVSNDITYIDIRLVLASLND
ncbi:MAG: helix-turn-helix domain-containing protein [Prevotella sp.]|nr:helix-turn-helix domain-containing protein [Prevotella sp.]